MPDVILGNYVANIGIHEPTIQEQTARVVDRIVDLYDNGLYDQVYKETSDFLRWKSPFSYARKSKIISLYRALSYGGNTKKMKVWHMPKKARLLKKAKKLIQKTDEEFLNYVPGLDNEIDFFSHRFTPFKYDFEKNPTPLESQESGYWETYIGAAAIPTLIVSGPLLSWQMYDKMPTPAGKFAGILLGMGIAVLSPFIGMGVGSVIDYAVSENRTTQETLDMMTQCNKGPAMQIVDNIIQIQEPQPIAMAEDELEDAPEFL